MRSDGNRGRSEVDQTAPPRVKPPWHPNLVGQTLIGGAAAGRAVTGESTRVLRTRPVDRERAPVTLAPGRYTVQGFVFSAEDGSVQDLDDRTFTVS